MKGEWCYFKSYIDKATCEKIINDSKLIPEQDGIIGGGVNGVVNNEVRRSKVRFISSEDSRFTYLFDILWKTAIQANRDFFNIHITRLNFVQVAEYDAAYLGEYKVHQDVFWTNDNEDPTHHRKLSCVINLSDPESYVGGNLELVHTGTQLDKDTELQGSIIYFPSLFMHKANPVIRGTRYSVAAWFEGPKWS